MIDQDLRDFLAADATIQGLVGSGSPIVCRISPVQLPEMTIYPAITVQQISEPRQHTLDGTPTATNARYQITAWAKTYVQAKTLAEAIKKRCDGFLGDLAQGSPVQAMLVIDAHDAWAVEPMLYMCPTDVELFFNPDTN